MTLHQINGVEIFSIGNWNGDEYSVSDLDEMVDAFGKAGYRVPIKLGHDEKSGDRAFGWVGRIYRKGAKLLADFVDLPSTIYSLIKEKAYDAVSSEVYWNLTRDRNRFPRALKAVALLGAETPAVSNLKPVSASLSMPKGSSHAYTFALKETTMKTHDPAQQIVALVDDYTVKHPEVPWSKAFTIVTGTVAGKLLLKGYGQRRNEIVDDDLYEGEDAKETIHELAQGRMVGNKLTYSEAVKSVLADNDDLARAYARRS